MYKIIFIQINLFAHKKKKVCHIHSLSPYASLYAIKYKTKTQTNYAEKSTV